MSDRKEFTPNTEARNFWGLIQNLGPSLYQNVTGKQYPKQPKRESLAPGIYTGLTGKPYPENPQIIKPPSSQKPAAPAKPAEEPVAPRTGAGQNLPPSAAVPGTGPKDNQVGSDADPNTPGLQGSGAPGARINANGLQQYGQTLGGLNAFTSAFTGGYEITDIKTAFQSEDLPGA